MAFFLRIERSGKACLYSYHSNKVFPVTDNCRYTHPEQLCLNQHLSKIHSYIITVVNFPMSKQF